MRGHGPGVGAGLRPLRLTRLLTEHPQSAPDSGARSDALMVLSPLPSLLEPGKPLSGIATAQG